MLQGLPTENVPILDLPRIFEVLTLRAKVSTEARPGNVVTLRRPSVRRWRPLRGAAQRRFSPARPAWTTSWPPQRLPNAMTPLSLAPPGSRAPPRGTRGAGGRVDQVLVLSRRVGEQIVIGEDIVLTVVEVRNDTVRLGIAAPRHVAVNRAEVLLAVEEANRAAAQAGDDQLDAPRNLRPPSDA